MKPTKKQRQEIFNMFGGKCAYCGADLPEKGWHADHIKPCLRELEVVPRSERKDPLICELRHSGAFRNNEANRIDNFYPACAPCNLLKATFSLEGFRGVVAEQVNRANSYSVNFRTAVRFGQVQVTESPIVFWFEKHREAST